MIEKFVNNSLSIRTAGLQWSLILPDYPDYGAKTCKDSSARQRWRVTGLGRNFRDYLNFMRPKARFSAINMPRIELMAIAAPQNTAIESSGRIELFVKLLGAH